MSEQKEGSLEIKENSQKVESAFKYENPFLNKSFASATILSCTLIIIWRMLDQIGWRSLFPELFSSFDIIPAVFLVSVLLILVFGLVTWLPVLLMINTPIKFHLNNTDVKTRSKLVRNNFLLIIVLDIVCFLTWIVYFAFYKELHVLFAFFFGFVLALLGTYIVIKKYTRIDSVRVNKMKLIHYFDSMDVAYLWTVSSFLPISLLVLLYAVIAQTKEWSILLIDFLIIFVFYFFARIFFYMILKEKWQLFIKIISTIMVYIVCTVFFFGIFLPKGGDQLINQAFITIGARSWQVETFIIHEPNLNDHSFYQTSVFNQKDITYAPAGIKVNSVRLLFLGKVSLLCSPEVSKLEKQIDKWSQIASKCIAFDSNKVQKWQN